MSIVQAGMLPLASELSDSQVLLVDDDPACLEECAELLASLSYPCAVASSAGEALRKISEDLRIGIVVTDINMPGMDGLTFLEELASRFRPVRPLVPIVVTGSNSIDSAVQAMRFSAADFLTKPVVPNELAAALRRASARWAQIARHMLLEQGKDPDDAALQSAEPKDPRYEKAGTDILVDNIRAIIRRRQKRKEFLDSALFADPSWDILLDLTLARLEGADVPVSAACAAAQVPYTTALRYIRQLVDSGLVRRWKDPRDSRRVFLKLENRALDAMTSYVEATRKR